MKAYVMGTSNGIISDGYVATIRESGLFSKVVNVSLGGSSLCFFPYRLAEIDWENTDVLFVESLVNDAASSRAGTFSLVELRGYYEDLFYQCARNKTSLVCILLPGRTVDQHYDEALKIHRELMNEYKVSHWDLEPELHEMANFENVNLASLYKDAAHLCSNVIKTISAKHLLKTFNAVKPLCSKLTIKYEYLPFYTVDSDFSRLKSSENLVTKLVQNNLLKATGLIFKIMNRSLFHLKMIIMKLQPWY